MEVLKDVVKKPEYLIECDRLQDQEFPQQNKLGQLLLLLIHGVLLPAPVSYRKFETQEHDVDVSYTTFETHAYTSEIIRSHTYTFGKAELAWAGFAGKKQARIKAAKLALSVTVALRRQVAEHADQDCAQ